MLLRTRPATGLAPNSGLALVALSTLLIVSAGSAQADSPASTLPTDIPASFKAHTEDFDYVKREVMIPMHDGVKLKTFILIPKGATHAPMLLTRTPYNASERVLRFNSSHLAAVVPQMDDTAVAAG